MTRLFLASVGLAILQLGVPQGASAVSAGLRPGGESTRVVPRLEATSPGALTREGARTDGVRPAGPTPAAAAVPPPTQHLPLSLGEPSPHEAARSAPGSDASLLPRPRGPPA